MINKLSLLFIGFFSFGFVSNAQLADGTIAPDFTLTDRDGIEHHLYEYLDQGKVVFIKFFACHCPGCWAYHQTGRLDSLYEMYGPEGTDQIRVLMLEHDQNNTEAFSGQGTYTQGDWETGNSVPMIDVEGTTDRAVFDDYNLNYYPMLMKVCTDKRTELMSTQYTVQELFNEADDCPGNLGIENSQLEQWIYFNDLSKQLKLYGFNGIKGISLFSINGQLLLNIESDSIQEVNLNDQKTGLHLVEIRHDGGIFRKKLYIN